MSRKSTSNLNKTKIHYREIIYIYFSSLLFSFKKLILSETSIFDVLHDFYYHPNTQVRQSALEVRLFWEGFSLINNSWLRYTFVVRIYPMIWIVFNMVFFRMEHVLFNFLYIYHWIIQIGMKFFQRQNYNRCSFCLVCMFKNIRFQ